MCVPYPVSRTRNAMAASPESRKTSEPNQATRQEGECQAIRKREEGKGTHSTPKLRRKNTLTGGAHEQTSKELHSQGDVRHAAGAMSNLFNSEVMLDLQSISQKSGFRKCCIKPDVKNYRIS